MSYRIYPGLGINVKLNVKASSVLTILGQNASLVGKNLPIRLAVDQTNAGNPGL